MVVFASAAEQGSINLHTRSNATVGKTKNMKTIMGTTLLVSTFLLASNAQAQSLAEDKVPRDVRTAFAHRFPAAKKAKWEMEDATTYEVNFHQNGPECSAAFGAKGAWKETETEIKEAELPAAVRATLAKDYAGHKISECERVETPEGAVYEVEAEKGEQTFEVKLSADGKVLKVEEEKEKEGEEKDED
ncbi:MAG TPA: PepSY-like domain-containing protein [Flavobacteriales bacterium]|nr:PepSY-like domain-containing protein [Flavobacteriales bacterium]